ncbi:hypothetical protein [Clostridium nigeriense]|uniref:hypothetical protein n=1 Tax=Clostridium nigeriense TaxID=1805470 RepID=UPI00082BB028|nr:hypothetical protein [Clostridium nigeriense]
MEYFHNYLQILIHNEKLEKTLKIDEQYSYFGSVIDESYDRYKKEKFLEKYQSAYDNLEDLKEAIKEYKKNNNRIIKGEMFAFFRISLNT